ncbi:MAG: DUF4139 domain-containing protein [Flavobacteriales bacterium]|nr:DUF4139 domain-containing protein [Flavobacteriales bacterium]
MKFTLVILSLATVFHTINAQVNLSPSIDGVTVFTRGAEIAHHAETKLASGKTTVVFSGLSPDMNPNSIVLDAEPRNLTILSVTSQTNYLKPIEDNTGIAVAKDSLQSITDDINAINLEIEVLNNEKGMLFRNESIGGTSNNVPIQEIEKAADFYRKRMNEINTMLSGLKKRLTTRLLAQEAYSAQLNELNAKFNPPTSEITVVIVANEAVSKASFDLKYLVSKAGWAPKYDVRAENVDGPVELVYRANVFNDCGINWSDVKLKLSTADPLLGAEKPNLEAWDIARIPSVAGAMQEVTVSSYANMKDDYLLQKKPLASQDVAFTQVNVAELSTEFEILLPYTILADSKPYTVDVTEYSLPAVYEHYAAPKADSDAFLTAKITGWGSLNLVTGNASVYFAGTYLGQSVINTASVDDTMSISLGRDKKIMLQRDKLVELNKRQLIGNNEKETFFFETTVRNNRDKTIVLELADQVPISSDGDIVVENLELTEGVLDKPTGKVTWRITLAPGESKKVTLGYSIKSPKGAKLYKSKVRSVACPAF